VSWRPASAANLAFFKWFGVDQPAFCSPLQRLCAEIGQQEIARPGDTRSSLRVVVDRTRETCDHRNLPAPWIPTKSSKPLRPALRKRPFDLRTADCRPKGRSVMESQISKIYAPSNAAGCQLPINGFAHKAAVIGDLRVRAVLAAHDMAAESHRAAALDRRLHLQLAEADVTCIGFTPSRSMVAEDIRDLQGRTSHDRRGL
jgi:hypothetical protein